MDTKIAEGKNWEVRIDNIGKITIATSGYHGDVNWLKAEGIEIPKDALRAKRLIENELYPAANTKPITAGQKKRYNLNLSSIDHEKWIHLRNLLNTYSIFTDEVNVGSIYEKRKEE